MGKTAFIFPGQGAQYVGMARDFYDAFPECRDAVDQAADLLDFNLRGILFDENELIHKTEYTQAAMLVAEVCILRGVTLTGKTMDVTAGLSLGEYSARWTTPTPCAWCASAAYTWRTPFRRERAVCPPS